MESNGYMMADCIQRIYDADCIQRTYDGGWDPSAQSDGSQSEQVKAVYGSRTMSALATLGALHCSLLIDSVFY
jgi:hypothetical protein